MIFQKSIIKEFPEAKTLNYYIVTSGLTKSLTVQMRSGCEITSIKPDTLFFTLDKVIANSATDNQLIIKETMISYQEILK